MGYSTSEKTLRAMLPYMKPIAAGLPARWTTGPGLTARQLAYKIREALFIAREYPTTYPELAARSRRYRLRIVDHYILEGRPVDIHVELGPIPEPETLDAETSWPVTTTPLSEYSITPQREVRTVASVIDAWNQNKGDKLFFPRVGFSPDELCSLWEWSRRVDVLIFESDGDVTLVKATDDLREFAWTPDDISQNLT